MEPISHYEVIDFFSWVKQNEERGLNLEDVKEIIFASKYNRNILNKLKVYIDAYQEETGKNLNSDYFLESIFSWLYHCGETKEKRKIEKTPMSSTEHQDFGGSIVLNCLIQDEYLFDNNNEGLIVDFFEWLQRNSKKCTQHNFISLINDFADENDDSSYEKLKKISNKNTIKKLVRTCERFNNSQIYKCICFASPNDNTIKNVINKYWDILNDESRDFLDIYYSPKQLSKSGFAIKKKFKKLKPAANTIPCIAIWKDDMGSSEYIPLDGLNEEGVYRVFLELISTISKCNKDVSCKKISSKCNRKIKELKKENKNIKAGEHPKENKLVWQIFVPIVTAIVASIIVGFLSHLWKT